MSPPSPHNERKKLKLKRGVDDGAVKLAKKEKKRKDRDVGGEEAKPKRQKTDASLQESTPVKTEASKEVHASPKTETPGGSGTDGVGKRGKKRRRRRTQEEENLPEEERKRREEQRTLAAKAREMRAEGKVYKRPHKRLATEGAKQKLADPNAKMKNEAKYGDIEGSKPEGPVQVIVIPIFWNRKPEEKASVIDASSQIVKLLQGADIACGMDTTTNLSPGQKFAHWEKEGVKVRIECGPNDVGKGSCMLAVSKKAGELAQKQSCQVGQALVFKTKTALGIRVEAQTEDVDMDDEPLPKAETRKRPFSSGDDLGGDFNDFNLTEDNPKKRRKS